MPTSPIVQLQMAFGLAGVLFALWKGSAPERLAAVVVVANIGLGAVLIETPVASEDMLRFANDGLSAFLLLAVTIRYGAPWMGVVMLFYAAQFALHAAYMMLGRDPTDYLHAVVNNLNFSGVILCLAAGTAVAWRRRARARRLAATAGASQSPARRP